MSYRGDSLALLSPRMGSRHSLDRREATRGDIMKGFFRYGLPLLLLDCDGTPGIQL